MNNIPNKINPLPNMLLTIGLLPSSYIVSMTYEEQLLWLCNFLKTEVIPKTNANIEAVNQLIIYIDNYFNNLDVQDEIDNKLDEMLEQGTLQEIITEYLQVNGVLGYDTVSAMVNATNIINGSICKTLGLNTYNDGKGAFYKIRTITSGDTVDGVNIIALNVSNTLIAEKMPDYNINEINNKLNLINNKHIIIIGDSYSNHEFEDITKFWYESFAEYLGLTDHVNMHVRASDGAGFYNDAFYNRLYEARNLSTANTVTDILVVGGLNDRNKTESALYTKMKAFDTLAKTYFPNAKITLAYVGNTNPKIFNNYDNRAGVITSCIYYERNGSKLGWKFLKNTQFILHNYDSDYWEDDGGHPSQLGQDKLGIYITEAFLNGVCDVRDFTDSYYATMTASGNATAISNINFISGIDNETSYITKASPTTTLYFKMDSTQINCNGAHAYELGTLTKGYYMGTGNASGTIVPIMLSGTIDGNANTRVFGSARIYMEYGKLYIVPLVYNNNNTVVNDSLDYIFISSFDMRSSSYYA